MKEILVEPKSIWKYYTEKRNSLSSIMYEIASNKEYGVTIYLTESDEGTRGATDACIVVEADDIEVYSEVLLDEEDAENTCRRIYDKYLSDTVVDIISNMGVDGGLSIIEQEDNISERELELDEAVELFLDTVASGCDISMFIDDDVIEDVKDHFCEYLARKWDVPVFRPMFLEDENGKEFYEEYPYGCMEYDDEDNPIYN